MSNTRNRLIAKVKIGCKQLDLLEDREAYEAMLFHQTGKTSCGKMGITELNKVIKHMVSRGAVFTNKGNKRKHAISPKAQIRMVFGLWTDLYKCGAIERPDREALRAWVQRMTKTEKCPEGVGDPDWLDRDQAGQCIESLKQWLARVS